MKVELLTPDVAPLSSAPEQTDASLFARTLDELGSVFSRADTAEDAYANGGGSLGDAVYERARADVALSVAAAVAQHATQALTTLFNLQL